MDYNLLFAFYTVRILAIHGTHVLFTSTNYLSLIGRYFSPNALEEQIRLIEVAEHEDIFQIELNSVLENLKAYYLKRTKYNYNVTEYVEKRRMYPEYN